MSALFEAYVTNLGKYNEGELVGEYLKFPMTPEEVQALLKRIGIDGVRYEEIFITDFDGDVLGLYDHLGEYENIDELRGSRPACVPAAAGVDRVFCSCVPPFSLACSVSKVLVHR